MAACGRTLSGYKCVSSRFYEVCSVAPWTMLEFQAPVIMNVGMLINSGLKSAIFLIFFSLRPKKQVIIVCLPHYFNL